MESKDKTSNPFGEMKPNDFAMDEDRVFMALYNVWNRAKRTENVQREILEIELKNQELLKSNIVIQLRNEKLLSAILEKEKAILVEEKASADEGEYIIINGTVSSSSFTIIDTDTDPGHPVKGYFVRNTGNFSIFIAHNAALSSVGPDVIDVNSNITRFEILQPNDTTEASFNRNKIKNIYLLASGGDTTFKTKLVW